MKDLLGSSVGGHPRDRRGDRGSRSRAAGRREAARAARTAASLLLRTASVAVLAALVAAAPGRGGEPPGAGLPVRDVIVLLIDTCRFDALGANAGRPGLTPEFDRVAAESIRFRRAFSPSNLTSLAMPGVLASIAPRTAERRLPEEASSLAELLRSQGYRTLGISTNPNVSEPFGYAQGFDVFLDPTRQPGFLITHMLQIVGALMPGTAYAAGMVDAGLYYPPFADVRRRALDLFDSSMGPTFLYLHTMDPHGPYLPPLAYLPEEFRAGDFFPYYRFNRMSGRGELGAPKFERHLRNLEQRYEGEVRYSDLEFGRLVEALKARARWDESLVWVLSDHGEAFGEHDFAGHGGENLTTTLIHVPLLLKLPRSWAIAPRVDPTPVSTLDVVPTTLSLLGAPVPPDAFGRDLAPIVMGQEAPERRTLISYAASYLREESTIRESYAAIAWPWKLDVKVQRGRPGDARLFQLESDPGELRDVAAHEPDVVRRLIHDVVDWREREQEYIYGPGQARVDDRVREQLRQLGYVE